MTNFIQLHLLTSYPPANLNRDDLGRPKTAVFGGTQRLRVSSQSLKRAWRTSEVFELKLSGHLGQRTKVMGDHALRLMTERGMDEKLATNAAKAIVGEFASLDKKGRGCETGQLVHFSGAEQVAINDLCALLAREGRVPTGDELGALRTDGIGTVDIALFGRMLAEHSEVNVEAACQVAHALGVHGSVVEDDYFSAVDDLNTGQEDMGAGHIGELGFGAAVFYLYLCIDRDLLAQSLGGDEALVRASLSALAEATATVAPRGKQNSFGSRAYASFIMAEVGEAQPRSLSVAFLEPVDGSDLLRTAIGRLVATREAFASTYGERTRNYVLDATVSEGSLDSLIEFVSTTPEPVAR